MCKLYDMLLVDLNGYPYLDFICSQLLPHAAYVVRLVTRYFRSCALPELRIKLYSITRMLLTSMGVGKQ